MLVLFSSLILISFCLKPYSLVKNVVLCLIFFKTEANLDHLCLAETTLGYNLQAFITGCQIFRLIGDSFILYSVVLS